MGRGCDFGMKAVSGDHLADWPESQCGRELTIYIFQYDQAYAGGGPMMECCKKGTEHRYWLGPEFERDSDFWTDLVREGERLLCENGLRNNGRIAHGDLSLGGPYASLRNEAFVFLPEPSTDRCNTMSFIYPPNYAGWNAAGHDCPVRIPWKCRVQAAFGIPSLSAQCRKRR